MSLQHCIEISSTHWGFWRTVSHVREGEAYMGAGAAVWELAEGGSWAVSSLRASQGNSLLLAGCP